MIKGLAGILVPDMLLSIHANAVSLSITGTLLGFSANLKKSQVAPSANAGQEAIKVLLAADNQSK